MGVSPIWVSFHLAFRVGFPLFPMIMGGKGNHRWYAPLKFNIAPEKMIKMDGWKTILSYWVPVTFQGRTVSFREGNCLNRNANSSMVDAIPEPPPLLARQVLLHHELPGHVERQPWQLWLRLMTDVCPQICLISHRIHAWYIWLYLPTFTIEIN